ncbi:MAG: HAD family phosphatase [Flavobacteriaceae bacterium]|nr:HAD family phosphatase [Flavobacteriaceae bacterium]
MIENIIFDLGDVFVNLDHKKFQDKLHFLGLKDVTSNMTGFNQLYEKGLVSTKEFKAYYKDILKKGGFSDEELVNSWVSILGEFPLHRLLFLENIPKKYRLFLLSNTNELHINHVQTQFGNGFYDRFVNCFDKIYYSHEIHMRKPDADPFQLIISENELSPSATLFVDDTLENIEMANHLGIQTWHINPEKDDVSELFTIKNDLFRV